jgi:hypothetical protein
MKTIYEDNLIKIQGYENNGKWFGRLFICYNGSVYTGFAEVITKSKEDGIKKFIEMLVSLSSFEFKSSIKESIMRIPF